MIEDRRTYDKERRNGEFARDDFASSGLHHKSGYPVITTAAKLRNNELCECCSRDGFLVTDDHRNVRLIPVNRIGYVDVGWTQPGDRVGVHVKPYITQHNGHCVSQAVGVSAEDLKEAIDLIIDRCPNKIRRRR